MPLTCNDPDVAVNPEGPAGADGFKQSGFTDALMLIDIFWPQILQGVKSSVVNTFLH